MDKTQLFEKIPVKKAVLRQIIPAVASQLIVLVYNLADTYFVGMLNRPEETASVTIAYPAFLMLTALSNLFGVGGAGALAQALGRKEPQKAGQISSVSFWFGVISGILYSLLFLLFANPILTLCGAGSDTYVITYNYAKWVIIAGGTAVVLNTLLANLIRAEGNALVASFGVSFGGILNIILDPIFVLPRFLGRGAEGAGMATAISNLTAAVFFLIYLLRNRDNSVIRLFPRYLKSVREHISTILSIGLPSALQYALTVAAVTAQAKFVSKYTTEAIAALGIAKKMDQLPLYFSIGTSSGLLPLLAYNHAAGNQKRRKAAFRFGCLISVSFALLCLIFYEAFAPILVSIFIKDTLTVRYAARFLRILVLAMPLMAFCYPMTIQFQAMGQVKEALIISILRKGALDIPLLFLFDGLFPLTGCMMVQPIVDGISMVVAIHLYRRMKYNNESIQKLKN